MQELSGDGRYFGFGEWFSKVDRAVTAAGTADQVAAQERYQRTGGYRFYDGAALEVMSFCRGSALEKFGRITAYIIWLSA
jgi:hypothetical protein